MITKIYCGDIIPILEENFQLTFIVLLENFLDLSMKYLFT